MSIYFIEFICLVLGFGLPVAGLVYILFSKIDANDQEIIKILKKKY